MAFHFLHRLDKQHFPLLFVRPLDSPPNSVPSNLPRNSVFTRNAAYLANDRQPLLVSRMYMTQYQAEPDSELAWFLKEEVRLMSAMSLARSFGQYRFVLEKKPLLIKFPEVSNFCQNNPRFRLSDVAEHIPALAGFHHVTLTTVLETSVCQTDDGKAFSPKQIYNLIDPNHVHLVRCLAAWLKADMLFNYVQFAEEACTMLYIALEGITRLFYEELKFSNPKISMDDTIEFITQGIPDPESFGAFLKKLYEYRVMLVHPINNIGDYWNVPLMADDYLDITHVFQYLALLYITGEPVPSKL